MIIGILGLSHGQFDTFCRLRGYDRVSEIEYKHETDNYILIDNIMCIYGRHFDKILDFNPLRMEVLKRMSDKNEYYIGHEKIILD